MSERLEPAGITGGMEPAVPPRVVLRTRLSVKHGADLLAALREAGFDAGMSEVLAHPVAGGTRTGLTLTLELVDDAGADVARTLAGVASQWLMGRLRMWQRGDPGYVRILFGPDGRIVRRVSTRDGVEGVERPPQRTGR